MSEPIQSIAQNNYILHNIDAKKLYVQEPLFTANSGDAVYVGWRPDETVLYSGNSNITTGALSEPATNFNYLRVSFAEKAAGAAYPGGQLVSDLDINECLAGNNISSACAGLSYHELGTSVDLGLRIGIFYLTSPTTFSSYHVEKQANSTAAAGNIGNMWVSKVIGINRKENA